MQLVIDGVLTIGWSMLLA